MAEPIFTIDEKVDIVVTAPAESRQRLICVLASDEAESKTLARIAKALEQNERLEAEAKRKGTQVKHATTTARVRQPGGEKTKIDRQFDGFELDELINGGSYGTVWKASQKYEGGARPVAIKILSPKSQFKNEINNLAGCAHPNVVHLYGFGQVSGRRYLAMELVAGGELLDYSRRRNLGLRDRLSLFLEICDGVQCLHSKGVIHYDLKPSNILVDQEDHPKIVDFGLSDQQLREQQSLFEEINQLSARGTAEYASPEAFCSNSSADTRADVYSLGIILFQMLTGGTPYRINRALEADGTVLKDLDLPEEPSELVQYVPREELIIGDMQATQRALRGDLDAIILKATKHDAADRYSSVTDLAEDVKALLSHNCVSARVPRPRLYAARKFIRRSPLLAAAILGFVIFSATLCVLAFQLSHSNSKLDAANTEIAEQNSQLELAIDNEIIARKAAEESQRKTERQALSLKNLNAALRIVFEGFSPHLSTAGDGKLREAFVGRMTKVANEIIDKRLARDDDGVEMRKHLAETLNIFGQAEVSTELWKSISDDLESRNGKVHKDTLAGLLNLARTQLRTQPKEALSTMLVVDRLGRELFPPEHAAQREIDHILAEAYSRTGNEQLAFEIMSGMLARLENGGEMQFEPYIDFLNSYGMLALKMGKLELAKQLISRAIRVGKTQLSESHPFILICRQNLVMVNDRLGLKDKVVSESREILKLLQSQLPENSPTVVQAKHQLATYLANKDSYPESLKLFQEIIDGEGPLANRLQAELEIHTIRFLFTEDVIEKRKAVAALENLAVKVKSKLGPEHPLIPLSQGRAKSYRAILDKNE